MQISDLVKLKRFKDIVTVLVRYGFDEIVQRMELPGSDLIRKIRPVEEDLSIHERIRLAIEEMGPTFVKFGQIMSLRPDLLPKALLDELEKLQDDVPALDFKDIEKMVVTCFGRPIDEVFSVFDVEPLAAASLSQVHRGVLNREGQIVAVKIQRPDISETIQSDLAIFEFLASFLDQNFENLQVYDLPGLVQVTRRNLMNEIDFTNELRNMKIARSFADETDIYIPEVFEEYSSDKVLVMEFVNGNNFKEITRGAIFDGKAVAKQGLHATVKQILEDGFFHADPHPGNLMVTEDMNLCIIDWGMVGRLTENDRFELTGMLKAVVDKDSEALTHSLIGICQAKTQNIQTREIERALLNILDNYYAVPVKDIDIGNLLMSITGVIRNYQLQLPTDFAIMIKALVTAEGSARLACPELDVVTEVRGHVSKLATQRFNPETIWRNLRNSLSNLWSSQRDLPRHLQQIIGKLDKGELGFQFRLNKLEELIDELENASKRLTIGLITGAIIMGSSMIITTGIGPYLFGFPALGVIGYLMSVILGFWLVITILRGKKK